MAVTHVCLLVNNRLDEDDFYREEEQDYRRFTDR